MLSLAVAGIPALISIRDEDYNRTPISGKTIQYGIVELILSKEEAEQIYNSFTKTQPHAEHRTFEEAWQSFGGQGPLIEFVYLLTNNQTFDTPPRSKGQYHMKSLKATVIFLSAYSFFGCEPSGG